MNLLVYLEVNGRITVETDNKRHHGNLITKAHTINQDSNIFCHTLLEINDGFVGEKTRSLTALQ